MAGLFKCFRNVIQPNLSLMTFQRKVYEFTIIDINHEIKIALNG
jgi:hypothetical protein